MKQLLFPASIIISLVIAVSGFEVIPLIGDNGSTNQVFGTKPKYVKTDASAKEIFFVLADDYPANALTLFFKHEDDTVSIDIQKQEIERVGETIYIGSITVPKIKSSVNEIKLCVKDQDGLELGCTSKIPVNNEGSGQRINGEENEFESDVKRTDKEEPLLRPKRMRRD